MNYNTAECKDARKLPQVTLLQHDWTVHTNKEIQSLKKNTLATLTNLLHQLFHSYSKFLL